jgi:hypothetical protein
MYIEIMALPLGGLAIDWCKRVRRTGPSQILRFHMLMAFQYDVCRLLKYALTLLTRERYRDIDREILKREYIDTGYIVATIIANLTGKRTE